ncbi:MAG: LysM peptidoglycan-binding domain-containing protein, partial [Chloroflexi bacterium]|nr:LysM peptidoglycan-binding domain-containing protein [Chloroflexota bacterium]
MLIRVVRAPVRPIGPGGVQALATDAGSGRLQESGLLLAPTSARRVMGLLSSVPGVGVRRVRRPMESVAVVAGTRIQRLLAGRAAAPALVLLIVTLTAFAAIVPLGVRGSADPPLALAAEAHGGSVAAAPLGSSTRSEAMDADVTRLTLTDTSQGAFVDPLAAGGVAGLVLGAEGSLIKPVIPASRAPGVAPVVERYRAVRGDSLWSISRRFGTDTMSLWWANVDRLRDGLKVGHLLLIPPGHGVLHSVVQGDTLGTISARYRSSPASIIKANALRGEVVILGQLLLIPDGRGPSYPRGLLPGRPAMESTRPVDSAPGAVLAPRTIGARDGFDGSSERGATDTLLAGGALRYGDLVAGNLASTASRPGTAAVGGGTPGRGDDGPSARTTANGTVDPGDDQTAGTSGSTGMTGVGGTFETPKGGGRGAQGGASRPVDGSGSASGGGDTASDAEWALGASPEVLESWGLTGPGDHGSLILLTSDDADRASRQLEAAAAREEARRIAA